MPIKPPLFWYSVSFLLLVHIQLNLHNQAYFIGAAVLIGLFPIRKATWYKYALLELGALACCLVLNFPNTQLLNTLGSITTFGSIGLIAASVIVSTISFTLVATTAYHWITSYLFRQYLRGSGV